MGDPAGSGGHWGKWGADCKIHPGCQLLTDSLGLPVVKLPTQDFFQNEYIPY